MEVTKRRRNETWYKEKTMVGTRNLKICRVEKLQRGRTKYLLWVLKNANKTCD